MIAVNDGYNVALRTIVPILLVLGLSNDLLAQSVWSRGTGGSGLDLEFSHPFYDSFNGGTPYGSFVISGWVRTGPSLRVEAHVPVSLGTEFRGQIVGDQDPYTRGLALGNPYVGVEYRPTDLDARTGYATTAGLFLPLLGNDADYVDGLFDTHWIDRVGALLSETLTIRASQLVEPKLGGPFALRIWAGPDILVRTGDVGRGDRSEIMAVYGGSLVFEEGTVQAAFGVEAMTLLTEDWDGASFDDRTWQHARLDAAANLDRVRPHVGIRMPVGGADDDYLNDGWLLTVGIGVRLGE